MDFRILALLAMPLLACLSCPPARAAEGYDNCTGFVDALPASISTQGVWCLRKDLGTALAAGAAIVLDGNNITLDCNGFKLGGMAAGPSSLAAGVQAIARRNVTVRHCNLRGFHTGIELLEGSGLLVEDNRLDNNLEYGIRIGGDVAMVRGNRIFDTGGATGSGQAYGIVSMGSLGDTIDIIDNTISGVFGAEGGLVDVTGILVNGGRGSRVSGNLVRGLRPEGEGNLAMGIRQMVGTAIHLEGNRVVHEAATADAHGIFCRGPQHVSLRGNTAWGFGPGFSSCRDAGDDEGGNVAR